MKRFLKCSFCHVFNKAKHNKCVLNQLKPDESYNYYRKCNYGTPLSIWKWFVRIFVYALILAGSIFVIWGLIGTIRFWFFTEKPFESNQRVLYMMASLVYLVILAISLIRGTSEINYKFRNKGGTYFK